MTITFRAVPIFFALSVGATTACATCWQSGQGTNAIYRHPSVPEEFREARFVVLGRATHEQNISSAEDPDGYDWTVYDVEILQAFKGTPPRTMRLLSENSSSRFPMEAGKTYLLFVSHMPMVESEGNDVLPQDFVDNCGNSDALDAAGAKLMAVKQLSQGR
jgi:hypothetical protein